MDISRHWRLNRQRYAMAGTTCPNCGQPMFPPRPVCPHCAAPIDVYELGNGKTARPVADFAVKVPVRQA